MKKIQLGHHQEGRKYKNPIMYATVDDEDFDELNKHKWHATKIGNTFYARRQVYSKTSKKIRILMHREIMNTPPGMETDHIDRNGLNNCRENLRICTKAQNRLNQGPMKNNTSGYKGVSWASWMGKWLVQISINGKQKKMGYFSSKEEANSQYYRLSAEYHGEFANK